LAIRVVLTSVAARDLPRVQDWYGQRGSGRRAKLRAQAIVAAIQRLAESATLYPGDPYRPGNRVLIVEDHVVSFRLVVQGTDASSVFVERIYGPGQDR